MDAGFAGGGAGFLMRMIHHPQAFFRIMANQRLTWTQAIAELVDNSFDAGANRVELKFNGTDRFWQITDDGNGCPDISKMIPLGSHVDHGSVDQPLGMYGIGLKDAWLFSGNTIHVESVCRGKRGTLTLSTSDVNENWEAPDPSYEDCECDPGTTIVLSLGKDRRLPRDETYDGIRWLFTPALQDGKQIIVSTGKGARRKKLSPIALPPFAESVDESFEVDGKQVTIRIGIVADGHKMRHGPFWVTYGHRIIMKSAIGSGGYDTLRMGGQIKLGRGWSLTKNKDDLSAYADDLGDAILARIEPLLKKHEQLAEEVESSELRKELESMLNSSLVAARREKRDAKTKETGAVLPKSTGRRRRKAEKVQDGDGSIEDGQESKRKRYGFEIKWTDDDDGGLGDYDILGGVVRLNVAHPFIADAKAAKNRPALYSVAVSIMAYEVTSSEASGGMVQRLLWVNGPFRETYSRIMRTINGKVDANGKH